MQNSLSNFEEISRELSFGSQIISEENSGLVSNLLKLKNSIDKISNNSDKFKLISQRLSSIRIELEDIADEIDNFLDSMEQSPEKLNSVIIKIDLINNLLRKHSLSSLVELSEFRDNLSQKVATTENIDKEIEETRSKCDDLEINLKAIAYEIHEKRKSVIPNLTSEIESVLHELGMTNSRFKINLVSTEKFYANGMDTIEFEFLANKGYEFKKIREAASGGEMSRIMLAIKSIMAKYRNCPPLFLMK